MAERDIIGAAVTAFDDLKKARDQALIAAAERVVRDHSIEFQDSAIDTSGAMYALDILRGIAGTCGSSKETADAIAHSLAVVNGTAVYPVQPAPEQPCREVIAGNHAGS